MSIDIQAVADEIRLFCKKNASLEVYEKYNKYFKGQFDGVGIEQKVFEQQRDKWIKLWNDSTDLEDYLDLGDYIFKEGKFEEKSFIIHFIKSKYKEFNKETFNRISRWFSLGFDNWALCDVLCMLVLSLFIEMEIIEFNDLKSWCESDSEWQRRSIPVTLNELVKKSLDPHDALMTIEPIMLDNSEYVQKGIGTLLRSLWKKHPKEIENFLLTWKDQCSRKIIQYATEKMDKELKAKFKKKK